MAEEFRNDYESTMDMPEETVNETETPETATPEVNGVEAEAERNAAEVKSAVAGEKANKRTAFQVMEAYKMIRTNLLFSLATTNSRVVVFSSAEPSAGKSTLSANLAIVMAQTGARVLLVDADMRKPSQHRNFKKSRSLGLSKVLGGLNTLDECIHTNVKPNVDLITSGPTPPNPSELLGSARMKELVEELQTKYDYVFVDMPPLCVVADALVVAPNAAGVVLVAAGWVLRTHIYVDMPWLLPLGFRFYGFSSSDYFPLMPNLGYFLLGAAAGRGLYRQKKSLLPDFPSEHWFVRFWRWCGRNSLMIYLLHQPVLAALCECYQMLRKL